MYKKSISIVIILLFLISNSISYVSSNEISSNNIIYVDDDGGADYTRIQDAIDNASDEDIIFVYSGMYFENIVIDKSIILQGEDKNTTIIDGENSPKWHNVIELKADTIEIKQFTIQNSIKYKSGISLDSNNSIISNNIFKYNTEGIDCTDRFHNTISKNKFIDNSRSIVIRNSDYNMITKNIFNNCSSAIIGFLTNHDNNISYNTISNCRYESIRLIGNRNNISYNNIQSNVDNGIYISGGLNIICNNIIENNTYSGINCQRGKNNTIQNNIIKNNGDNGIFLSGIENSTINNNYIINNNGVGLFFYKGENNSINNNLIKDSDRYSIYMSLSPSNYIRNNNFMNNYGNAHYVNCDNIWRRNYYEKPRMLPYIISGTFDECPLQIDWFPRLNPYNNQLEFDNYE